jgi:peptidoglycan L-alanyl-D-glutamate endopeptidase CwlK
MQRAQAAGLRPVITEGKRSQARQNELWAKGRTCSNCGYVAQTADVPKVCPRCGATNTFSGKVVTRTRKSAHSSGLAVDIYQLDEKGKVDLSPEPGFYDQMAQIARSLGIMWGGDWKGFKDKPHFQYRAR